MGFLNPWLLVGLAGISFPILIHLLNRFRQRRIDWAAMELLRRAIVIRQRRILVLRSEALLRRVAKVEDLLLLALRCLAVLLVALSMSRPTLPTSGAKWFGGQEEVGAVIAIDGSFSMGYQPGVGSRFDRAVETVRDLKGALDPGDPMSMVLMGNRPRVILRSTGYDDRRLDKVLKDLQPLPEPLNLEACLDQLLVLVREIRAPVRECYLVTDAQAVTWGNLSEKSKRLLGEIGQMARIFVLPVAPDAGENVALTNLALASGSLRRGTMARLVAEVRNFGRLPHDRMVVSLMAGDKPVDQRVVENLGPGSAQTVPLFVRLDEPGNLRLTATIGHDALDADNTRSAVARVRDQVKVLVVDGDPSGRTIASYTLDLPQGTDIKLNMSLGIQQDAPEGQGVRFEAAVNGAKVLDRKVTAAEGWLPAEIDLSPHAGKRIVLDLTVDAMGKATGDWALVGEPRITAGGAVAADLLKLAPLATARIAIPGAPAERLSWEAARSVRPTGEVDIRQLIPGPEMAVAYAAADLQWPRDETARLVLEADGPVKLWVNDQKVAERTTTSGPIQVSASRQR
jgi:hypothetical protein